MLLLRCATSELNLAVVLLNGQSFRWSKVALKGSMNSQNKDCYIGVARHRLWKLWREDDENVAFEVLARFSRSSGDDSDALKSYFQLEVSLSSLYSEWSDKDKYFADIVSTNGDLLLGIRILAQDPVETLFSFICSANNNIKRISRMVERLCELYGERRSVSCASTSGIFYDFAEVQKMAADETMEEKLRSSGFGYRAAYLSQTAKKLMELGGEPWLNGLISQDYEEVKERLQLLPGVGPKVADCICLMGFRKNGVVPVDTHVFKVTAALFMPHLKEAKSVTRVLHKKIGEIWKEQYGDYAGWAHSVLFSAELRHFEVKSAIVKPTKAKIKQKQFDLASASSKSRANSSKLARKWMS